MTLFIRYAGLLLAGLMLLLLMGCVSEETFSPGPPEVDDVSGDPEATLTVFAAASLTDAFTVLEHAFEDAHPGVEVVLNLAGSQQLAQQLRLGAPADVFASANRQQMEAVIEAGRIEPGEVQVFARNRLVVVMPGDNPADLVRLQDLTRPGLQLVLAAGEVPAGQYTREFLDNASREEIFGPAYAQDVLAGVVSFEQNVRAVLTKVVLGEADAGIVYASDIVGTYADEVTSIEIPEALNAEVAYPIASVAGSPHPELVRAFIAFVLTPEGQEIIGRYGFTLARPS